MNKKKGLIYDSQKYFARFLKHEFNEYFTFDVYSNFKNFDNKIDHYSFILFVVYSDLELIDLFRIYKKGVPLIVCTLNKEMKLKLEKIDDILLFDSSKIKSEMRIELKFYLNII